jgi:hypothetical protein
MEGTITNSLLRPNQSMALRGWTRSLDRVKWDQLNIFPIDLILIAYA